MVEKISLVYTDSIFNSIYLQNRLKTVLSDNGPFVLTLPYDFDSLNFKSIQSLCENLTFLLSVFEAIDVQYSNELQWDFCIHKLKI